MTSVILKSINRNLDSTSVSSFKSFEVKIDLPITLGRGPVIKCPDKKISRNHVMIDWDDEGVLLTSIHVKPTFIVINGEKKSLTQGQSEVLKNGDRFGLLEDNYWYKESSPRCEKIRKELSPCLSSTEPQTDKNENDENVGTVNNEVHLTLEKDTGINEESKEPLIRNNANTESNKIEDLAEETDKKEDELGSNLPEANYNPKNNRKRTLPDWMSKAGGKGESNEKKSSEKVRNLNEKQSKKINVSRPSKKVTEAKFHELSDEDDGDDFNAKTSPKKIKKTNAKKQYHTISQDFDNPNSETENIVPGVISKNEIKASVNANVCSLSDTVKVSPKKETKRVNHRLTKKANTKNQYHSVSQDFDSPDFETEINADEVINQKNGNKANIKEHVCSDSDDGVVSPRKGTNKVNQTQIKQSKAKNQYHSLSQNFDGPDFEAENSNSESISKNNNVSDISTNVTDVKEVNSHKKEHDLSDDDGSGGDEPSISKPAKIKISNELKKNTPRKSCQYGEDCYRNNPKHRKELAHPGDSDYASHESASDDENDDRQECEYGLNCYRKNPQHRKDFKHTKKPQPPRNAKRKAKRKNDSDDSDEYDFDDPFLNDESSDDYAPTDSSGPDSDIEDTVQEEDTKRMMKEAKKFVKKRKN
ncbi:Aprataxin and PNK-like factor [Armadillidium nasatum]|uniref:Aprataxin and PNK-like factor n=1 Tax=Armadillidium nasatum TaxID=96803 RepID=A0A5N5T344_9CRUS|nr:Aprataxin and PNK-like factor [Armadillidium nasatum]